MTAEDPRQSIISFTAESDDVIRVQDELEGQDFRLTAVDRSPLEQAPEELFLFPVDNAISFTTTALRIPGRITSFLRAGDGEHIGEFSSTPREVSRGTYYLEFQGVLKAYIRIEDTSFTAVKRDGDSPDRPLHIDFDGPARVAIGARSFHRHPQATITVPDDPATMLEALPYLGSSIKEFSAERSWPSLRGHPPRVERGDELDIPTDLHSPDTGVTLTVPPNYADCYRIAPLAFYLGASIEVGSEPALHLETGYTEPLRTDARSLETSVDELLSKCLVLDTLTRVGGYYSFPRYEYDELAAHLPFYPPNLYDASLSEQLMEYLEVSYETIEPYTPYWPSTAVLQPRPDDIEYVPFLLDSLSRIHVAEDAATYAETRTRSASPTSTTSAVTAYTHDHLPDGSARLARQAFDNALDYRVPNADDAQFTFVTNSHEQATRLKVRASDTDSRYSFDIDSVTVVEQPTREKLQDVLTQDTDFLYCDVPVSTAGFECRDGVLTPGDVDKFGATMFGIQGDPHLETAMTLTEHGAITGVVTERALSAEQIARLIACLFKGYPLPESALLTDVGRESPYRFVGAPDHVLVHLPDGSPPARIDINSTDLDEHELTVWTQPNDMQRLGSIARLVEGFARDAYQLTGVGARQPLSVTTEDVLTLFEDETSVIRLNGELYFDSVDVTEAFVHDSARESLFSTE